MSNAQKDSLTKRIGSMQKRIVRERSKIPNITKGLVKAKSEKSKAEPNQKTIVDRKIQALQKQKNNVQNIVLNMQKQVKALQEQKKKLSSKKTPNKAKPVAKTKTPNKAKPTVGQKTEKSKPKKPSNETKGRVRSLDQLSK
jgi:chromosome segregation ATPase